MLPVWSAAVDPRVLVARAEPAREGFPHAFDAASADAVVVSGPRGEHLLVRRGDVAFRLDVVAGTIARGPVMLHFDLADDERLPTRLAVLRRWRSPSDVSRHLQLAPRLLGLQALDARAAGASLRETADDVLGPGHWPGDGEHRKSLIRRLIATGAATLAAGPQAVLCGIGGASHDAG